MFADVAVRGADIRLGGRQPVQQGRARASRVIAGAALVFVAIGLAGSIASAALPRSYYQLAVIINDSRAPTVAFTFWLDSPFTNTTDNITTTAKTIDITVNFGPELALDGEAGATYTRHMDNVLGDAYFFVNTTNARPGASSVFTTVNVSVVYTDMDGARPRTIFRSLTFALYYVAPPTSVNLMAAAAAGLGSAGALGLGLYVIRRARLEELYLMHDSGMLIRHWSRSDGMVHDSDIMSGMFIVLQEFVRDSFDDRQGSLEQLRFGQRQVLMVRGQHTVLAAVIQGRYLNALPTKLQRAVFEFERNHADILARWDGNVALLPYADAIADRFIRPRLRLHPN